MFIIARIEREKDDSLINLGKFYKATVNPDNKEYTDLWLAQNSKLTIEMPINTLFAKAVK